MAETSWTDRKVIEMSRNFVCLVGHRDPKHGSSEVLVGREKLKLCSKYYTIPCETHVEGAKLINRFFQGSYRTPTIVFLAPSGEELFRKVGGLSPGELVRQMEEAFLRVPGEKILSPLWQTAQQLVQEAQGALEKKDARKAIAVWTKLGKLGRAPWFTEKSREGLEEVEAEGRKLLEETRMLEPAVGKKMLQKIADDFRPLPVSEQARKELETFKRAD